MSKQLKMSIPDEDFERYARTGATQVIVDDRLRHAQMERRFPGILAEAIRKVRAARATSTNGHQVEPEPQQQERPRRHFSAAARRRISLAQKRRWAAKRKKSA